MLNVREVSKEMLKYRNYALNNCTIVLKHSYLKIIHFYYFFKYLYTLNHLTHWMSTCCRTTHLRLPRWFLCFTRRRPSCWSRTLLRWSYAFSSCWSWTLLPWSSAFSSCFSSCCSSSLCCSSWTLRTTE